MTVYYSNFENVSVAAAQDFFEILASSDAPLRILRINITQNTSETSEQLSIIVKKVTGAPSSGSGGSTHTPAPARNGVSRAFGGTVEINNTSALTGGTQTVFWREGFNVLSGFEWRATPEDVIECGPSERIVINLPTGPGGSTPMNGIVVIEEG
jgi:hypothetical protein